ncbi:hypothetical protein VTI74DRAFT_4818 [Chaetomium olivicolor]
MQLHKGQDIIMFEDTSPSLSSQSTASHVKNPYLLNRLSSIRHSGLNFKIQRPSEHSYLTPNSILTPQNSNRPHNIHHFPPHRPHIESSPPPTSSHCAVTPLPKPPRRTILSSSPNGTLQGEERYTTRPTALTPSPDVYCCHLRETFLSPASTGTGMCPPVAVAEVDADNNLS